MTAELDDQLAALRNRLEGCGAPSVTAAEWSTRFRIDAEGRVRDIEPGPEVPLGTALCARRLLETVRFPKAAGTARTAVTLSIPSPATKPQLDVGF